MFRLVHLTFHGEERFHGAADAHHAHGHEPHVAHVAHGAPAHAHGVHLHDAPWPMAVVLVVLAAGSIVAGYVNIPHALGGHAALNEWLKPAFEATNCGAPVTTGELAGLAIENCEPGQEAAAGEHNALELTLMAVSSLVAFAGIGLATFLWLKNRQIPERMAKQYHGLYNLLLNKYYVDEIYDAAIVQPIKVTSTEGLWRGFDVKVVDGAVNGAGYLVSGFSIVMRLLQNGSVKTYAMSTFVGVVAILAYYLWR
jgi:NADH-quinone oxidoreductase subunit L